MMRARTNTIQQGYVTPGLDRFEAVSSNNATMRFLRLMAATAQTKETRAVYLSFLDGERRLLPEHGGNKNEGIR